LTLILILILIVKGTASTACIERGRRVPQTAPNNPVRCHIELWKYVGSDVLHDPAVEFKSDAASIEEKIDKYLYAYSWLLDTLGRAY